MDTKNILENAITKVKNTVSNIEIINYVEKLTKSKFSSNINSEIDTNLQ